jgi:hypothetical protein
MADITKKEGNREARERLNENSGQDLGRWKKCAIEEVAFGFRNVNVNMGRALPDFRRCRVSDSRQGQ